MKENPSNANLCSGNILSFPSESVANTITPEEKSKPIPLQEISRVEVMIPITEDIGQNLLFRCLWITVPIKSA